MKGIYGIYDKTMNQWYIGKAKNSIEKRIYEHFKNYSTTFADLKMQKVGINNFDFYVLCNLDEHSELFDTKIIHIIEDYFIKKYESLSPKGFNSRINTTKEMYNNININLSILQNCQLFSDQIDYNIEEIKINISDIIINNYNNSLKTKMNKINPAYRKIIKDVGNLYVLNLDNREKFINEVIDKYNNKTNSEDLIINLLVQIFNLLDD